MDDKAPQRKDLEAQVRTVTQLFRRLQRSEVNGIPNQNLRPALNNAVTELERTIGTPLYGTGD